MNHFDRELAQRLEALRSQGLYRSLRRVSTPQCPRIEIDGRPYLNFSSNDYLGFANEPSVKRAAIQAVEQYGAGTGASRLICGSLLPHHELEEALADFKRTEAALSYSSGYATAVGTICALMGKEDIIVIDKLVHACVVDAARLSGATLRVFAHNDLNSLEDILKWAAARNATKPARVLVATESVFSMDGDHAPLRELTDLKDRYGAWLMVDEAHGAGLYGDHGRGLADELGAAARIEVQMGTLGKALGSSGGYICGSRTLIDYLINRARSFIFSTAPVPAAAAAAAAGLELARGTVGDERRRHVWALARRIETAIHGAAPSNDSARSVIIPIHIGGENEAVNAASALRDQGVFIPAIRYPTVGRGKARLRLTLSAAHSDADVDQLLVALRNAGVLGAS
jgi:8-amino-7-oxononanoate synthase